MNHTQRPEYIGYPGNVMMRSPLMLSKASLYGFFIKGDIQKLQTTVDECLNRISNNSPTYKVLSPYVLASYTKVAKAYSEYPEDREKGWLPEVDIVTWITVGEFTEKNGKESLSDILVFPHYIFVDNSIALINGRELYGYPKALCQFEIPDDPTQAEYFSCSVNAFSSFSATSEMQWQPLIEMRKTKSGSDNIIHEFAEGLSEFEHLIRGIPDFWHIAEALLSDVFKLLKTRSLPQIFLKQFPDSAGVKAVYQALVIANATVEKIRSIRFSGSEYECHVHSVASYPLEQTLGLNNGTQAAILPFHVDFDFSVGMGFERVNNTQIKPEKIAILGGGVASMTTAFYLTNQPGWQNKYDITIYQLGWRLGGKGASGRNPEIANRIQEHGLHIWFGFYDNAFSTMKQALDELDRPIGDPMRTLEDVFHPHSYIVLTEEIDNQWQNWQLKFPTNNQALGDLHDELDVWDLFRTGYQWLSQPLDELKHYSVKPANNIVKDEDDWLSTLTHHITSEARDLVHDVRDGITQFAEFISALPNTWEQLTNSHHGVLSGLLQRLREWLIHEFDEVLDSNADVRRLYIMADLGITVLLGMIKDDVFTKGFNIINDYDFKEWLTLHGANIKYSVNSAPVRGFYDLVFAYEDGVIDKPNVEAGTILRCMMQIALNYKGAIMWKMQAGMGDSIFTPYYEALKARGVKFEFFNQVDEIVSKDGEISEIHITEQVSLAKNTAEYHPLIPVPVEGYEVPIQCWPDRPNFEQLDPTQSRLLQQLDINLESFWSNWPEQYQAQTGKTLPQKTLMVGKDFDKVVCGISIAALPHIAPSVLDSSPQLQKMTQEVKTVATQAYQVWSNKTVSELGWTNTVDTPEHPVLSGFVEPFDTWAVMNQVIDKESWPTVANVNNIGYFCSVYPMEHYPAQSDSQFPQRCYQEVMQKAKDNLKHQLWNLWPDVAQPGDFDWSVLVDLNDATGESRFDSQYWRANIDPSERYVLSVKGSSQHRLGTDGTGLTNFFITGDWIKTPLNAGCVEAATMAGMQTSNAICGYPRHIANSKGL